MEKNSTDIQEQMLAELKRIRNPKPWEAFRNGIFAGLGTALGATLVLGLLLWVLQQFITVPVVGDYIKGIVEVVESR